MPKSLLLALAIFALVLSTPAQGAWKRLSKTTIMLNGPIEENSYSEFVTASRGGFSEVILKSSGGFPSVALKIALDISGTKNVSIRVDGYCISACANYLAFSGHDLTVDCDSILGFHGTLPSAAEATRNLEADGAPKGLIREYSAWLVSFHAQEDEFFARVGISKDIFSDTSSVIGALPPSGKYSLNQVTGQTSYTVSAGIWIPPLADMKAYGVKNLHYCPKYTRQSVDSILGKYGFNFVYSIAHAQR